MPFTNPDFPNQIFNTVTELQEAYAKRQKVEKEIENRSEQINRVTATIIPTPQTIIEKRLLELEKRIDTIYGKLREKEDSPTANKDGLPIGMVLKGESKGQSYSLEVLEDGYLCSTGDIEATLSSAAERVSGNRRSGWSFWKDGRGTPIGEITGRFTKHELTDPFGALSS